MPDKPPRLLIVYNADGGVLSAVADALHKVMSPATYPCSLCAVTYGAVSMRNEWRLFLESLPHEIAFHHRDDFLRAYSAPDVELPAILAERGGRLTTIAGKHEIDAVADAAELAQLVDRRLKAFDQQRV